MPLFSSTQPSLRARLLPKFPARVVAGNGMTITKSGGTYTFGVSPDFPVSGLSDVQLGNVLGRMYSDDVGPPREIPVGAGLAADGIDDPGLAVNLDNRLRAHTVVISGSPITTGIKADLFIPYFVILFQVILMADAVGSIVLDIWRDNFSNYPPTVADSVCGGAPGKPTLSSGSASVLATTGVWPTTQFNGGVFRFNVDSVSGLNRVTVVMTGFLI